MLARLAKYPVRLKWVAAGLLSIVWLLVYLTTVSPTVNFIDSGELIAAANEPGIAHAPGYPLYVLMGYVATHLLWGDVAWRLNVLSAFWGAAAVGAFFLLVYELSEYILAAPRQKPRRNANPARQPKPAQEGSNRGKASEKAPVRASQPRQQSPRLAPAQAQGQASTQSSGSSRPEGQYRLTWLITLSAAGSASLFAASSTFWSRTAQAKMYTLHFFFVFTLFLLALQCRRAFERNDRRGMRLWFIALAATLGLSFTNHLTTLLTVLPLAILLLLGSDFDKRFQGFLRQVPVAIIAFALPLLLYLYMPIRSSQNPIMNWGSPDNWGDFWRQITGWQFRPFLFGDIGANLQRNTDLVSGYVGQQWAWLTIVVIAAGLVGAALLARSNWVIFTATFTYALFTLLFSLFYGISEIEPYVVPLYAMLVLWIGLSPASWHTLASSVRALRPGAGAAAGDQGLRPLWTAASLIALVALGSAILIYPRQNYSHNDLAEQFVANVFDQLPPNSILITDYWDFYAPTYYMQMLKNVRPDLTLIDKSLLRYPFYTQQLRQRYPWLLEKSQDVLGKFSPEQRKWVNGQPFDAALLQQSYFDLMTSFVERNQADHPAFLLTLEPCDPSVVQSCEANQIAPTWYRQPEGLVTRLLPSKPAGTDPPPVPTYKLDGILNEPVYFDDAARDNTQLYADAFRQLSVQYSVANQQDKAQAMSQLASQVTAALAAR
jgi:hypothetical protein